MDRYNDKRRKFLKLVLFSLGAVILSPLLRNFSSMFRLAPVDSNNEKAGSDLTNFKVIDNNNEVVFRDKFSNEDILVIEK